MRKKQNGFTIIELLVGLSITTIILAAIVTLMSAVLPVWQKNLAKAEIEQTLRIGIDAVVREARYAKSMEVTQDSEGVSVLRLETGSNIVEFKLNTETLALGKRNNNAGGFQPVAGDGTGSSVGNIIIVDNPDGQLMFYKDGNLPKLLAITITARDRKTAVQLTMRTKIFCMNII